MHRFLLTLTVWMACLATPLFAQQQEVGIKPPFGLEWGESDARIKLRLAGAGAKIVDKHFVKDRDMWTVEGLLQANLSRTVFYFRNGGLVEVELQYQNPKWIDTDYNNFFGQLRQKVDARYGEGKLITRSKVPEGEVTETLVGYEWVKGDAAIQVIYFAAEKPSAVYRTVSLHYKSLN